MASTNSTAGFANSIIENKNGNMSFSLEYRDKVKMKKICESVPKMLFTANKKTEFLEIKKRVRRKKGKPDGLSADA